MDCKDEKDGTEGGVERMLAFLGGTLFGGALGIMMMCLVQINRE